MDGAAEDVVDAELEPEEPLRQDRLGGDYWPRYVGGSQ